MRCEKCRKSMRGKSYPTPPRPPRLRHVQRQDQRRHRRWHDGRRRWGRRRARSDEVGAHLAQPEALTYPAMGVGW